MKRRYCASAAAILLFTLTLPVYARAEQCLIPGGQVIGVQLENGTVTIAAFDDALGSAAREAGLQAGDEIISVNGRDIDTAGDVRAALPRDGEAVCLTVSRKGHRHTVTMTPNLTRDGPRLGVFLKQGIAGIGTVTWYNPDSGTFGTLGHGVSDGKGALLEMTRGSAFAAEVVSVKKGERGQPGQLRGSARAEDIWGQLLRNTPQGVFGITQLPAKGEAIPVAEYSQIRTGSAGIRSTVSGKGVQEYSVEILKIYPEDRPDGRNFLLKVTDPALLSATGGIVQGMSGSPIIQDGKLIGAVTHVLVNDPTTGYGIFIENMLDAAG